MRPDTILVRDWLKTAKPGTTIKGKFDFIGAVFEVHDEGLDNILVRISGGNSVTVALTNSIDNYTITPPKEAPVTDKTIAPDEIRKGDELTITTRGIVRYRNASGLIDLDVPGKGIVTWGVFDQQKAVITRHVKLTPTVGGTVLRDVDGTEYVRLGSDWYRSSNSGLSNTAVKEKWATGQLTVVYAPKGNNTGF